jgi:hypothetical protein
LWQKQGSEDLPTMSDALDRSRSGPSSATPQILHPDCKNADKQNVEGGDRSFSTQFPVQIDHQQEFVLLRHQMILQQVVAESSSTFHDKMLNESSKFIREEEPGLQQLQLLSLILCKTFSCSSFLNISPETYIVLDVCLKIKMPS